MSAHVAVHRADGTVKTTLELEGWTGLRARHVLTSGDGLAALHADITAAGVELRHGDKVVVASLTPAEVLLGTARSLSAAPAELTPDDYAAALDGSADIATVAAVLSRAAALTVTGGRVGVAR